MGRIFHPSFSLAQDFRVEFILRRASAMGLLSGSSGPRHARKPPGPSPPLSYEIASKFWSLYADRLHSQWEKTFLWDMIEPYRRPKSFTPLVCIYVAAFYTGVIGAALTEQFHKEKYWEDHPGEAVPLLRPKFYYGPWKVNRGETLPPNM